MKQWLQPYVSLLYGSAVLKELFHTAKVQLQTADINMWKHWCLSQEGSTAATFSVLCSNAQLYFSAGILLISLQSSVD